MTLSVPLTYRWCVRCEVGGTEVRCWSCGVQWLQVRMSSAEANVSAGARALRTLAPHLAWRAGGGMP